MNSLPILLATSALLSWWQFLLRAGYHGTAIKNLRDFKRKAEVPLGKVSVIIAARDEARMIGAGLQSLIEVDYPDLEVIVVDDRSTDGTSEIVRSFAARDQRIRSIRIEELPEGWLGKVHALDAGVNVATGEWLIFSDADVQFGKDVLRAAVNFATEEHLDHLALLPETHEDSGGFLVSLFVVAFAGMFVSRIKAASIGKIGSSAYCGVGAFNMVRSSQFRKTPGFAWLKMEVLDDVGVGLMMSKAGGKSALMNGIGLLHLEWYHSLREAIEGLQKNAFAGFSHYNFFGAGLIVFSMLWVLLLPIGVALGRESLLGVVLILFCYCGIPALGSILTGGETLKWRVALLLPLGYLFLAYALFRSTLYAWRNKGIRWRDTFYPLDVLRRERRVRL